jgi:hypothetical protein
VIRGLRVPVHLTSRDALRIFDQADIWAARTRNDVRFALALYPAWRFYRAEAGTVPMTERK